MQEEKVEYRKSELHLTKRLGITEKGYEKLKKAKREQKKSMAKIADELFDKHL